MFVFVCTCVSFAEHCSVLPVFWEPWLFSVFASGLVYLLSTLAVRGLSDICLFSKVKVYWKVPLEGVMYWLASRCFFGYMMWWYIGCMMWWYITSIG